VGRVAGEPRLRAIAQGKNNLAPEGATLAFELDPENGFKWAGAIPLTVDDLLGGARPDQGAAGAAAIAFLKGELSKGERPAAEMFSIAAERGIRERTLRRAKSAIGAASRKRGGEWLWGLAGEAADD
jgi:hypothetical protein